MKRDQNHTLGYPSVLDGLALHEAEKEYTRSLHVGKKEIGKLASRFAVALQLN